MDDKNSKEFLKAFDKLFMYATFANSSQLIKVYLDRMRSENIDKYIYEIEKSLKDELENNMKALEKEQGDHCLILCGRSYRIDTDGKIQICK